MESLCALAVCFGALEAPSPLQRGCARGAVSPRPTCLQGGARSPNPRRLGRDLPPLSRGGRASLFIVLAADQMAFLVEVVVEGGVS
jgi:hypothetical protein